MSSSTDTASSAENDIAHHIKAARTHLRKALKLASGHRTERGFPAPPLFNALTSAGKALRVVEGEQAKSKRGWPTLARTS